MNVLFNRFSANYGKLIKKRMIKELDVKHCVSIDGVAGYLDEAEMAKEGCDYKQYDFYEANTLSFKDIDWNKITPLDDKLVTSLYRLESDCMRLFEKEFNRHNPQNRDIFPQEEIDPILEFMPQRYMQGFLIGIPHDQRKRMYYKHLRYWNHFLETNKVELLVFFLCPHFIYEYILYRLAELKGIPVVWTYHSAIVGAAGIFNDIKDFGSEAIKHTMADLKQKYTFDEIKFEREEFQKEWDRLHQHYEKQERPLGGDIVAWDYLIIESNKRFAEDKSLNDKGKFKNRYTGWRKWKLRWMQWTDIDYWHLRLKFNTVPKYNKKLFNYYESLCQKPDLTKNFIYLPLHMQPEESNFPRGGMFANQEMMVDMLAHYLPDDWVIYIKEHPAQQYKHRSAQFYQDLAFNPKVKLVSKEFNTFELLHHCKAVATLNGTAGYEGLFKGKPTIMFGYFFYRTAPGVLHVRNNEDCKAAVDKIVSGEKIFDTNDLKYFLKAVELCTFRGGVISESVVYLGHTDEEVAEITTKAFMDKLKELNVVKSEGVTV